MWNRDGDEKSHSKIAGNFQDRCPLSLSAPPCCLPFLIRAHRIPAFSRLKFEFRKFATIRFAIFPAKLFWSVSNRIDNRDRSLFLTDYLEARDKIRYSRTGKESLRWMSIKYCGSIARSFNCSWFMSKYRWKKIEFEANHGISIRARSFTRGWEIAKIEAVAKWGKRAETCKFLHNCLATPTTYAAVFP